MHHYKSTISCVLKPKIKFELLYLMLTDCGQVKPNGGSDLSLHWLSYWPVSWWYQTITWTSVVLSSKLFYGIYLRKISQKVLINLIHNIYLKITHLKLPPHLSGGQWIIFALGMANTAHFKLHAHHTWFIIYCVLLCTGTEWFYPNHSGLLHWQWGNQDCRSARKSTLKDMVEWVTEIYQ